MRIIITILRICRSILECKNKVVKRSTGWSNCAFHHLTLKSSTPGTFAMSKRYEKTFVMSRSFEKIHLVSRTTPIQIFPLIGQYAQIYIVNMDYM